MGLRARARLLMLSFGLVWARARADPKPVPLRAVIWIMLCFICRVGEATQPGPCSDSWGLECINPNSLLGKTVQLQSVPQGIFAVSETCLSAEGVHRCKAELKSLPNPFRLIPGHPAPLRNPKSSSIGGKQVGVAFLSSFPARSIDAGWDPELYASSRLAAARFYVQGQWISGGVCYGYANRANTPDVQQATNTLLSQLTVQIVHGSSGPRFCAGDWNQPPHLLEEPKLWEQLGFQDLQTWAFQKFGIQPSVTCKGSTRKDYCYISQELQQLLLSVHLDPVLFTDHTMLWGFFRFAAQKEAVSVWPRPKPFPWTPVLQEQIKTTAVSAEPINATHPTEHYQKLCTQFENHMHQCLESAGLGGLQAHYQGRAKTVALKTVVPQSTPLKPSRHGERSPRFAGINLQYKRHFQQLRRLVNYCRLVRSPSHTTNAHLHKVALWSAIVRSPGFPPNFPAWWFIEAKNFAGTSNVVPMQAPSYPEAKALSEAFSLHVDRLEQALCQSKAEAAQTRRQADVNAIFRDIRAPGPEAVDTLLQQSKATIVAIAEDNSILYDPPDALQPNVPLVGPQAVHVTTFLEDGQAWLAEAHGLQPGQILLQQNPIGSVADIHARFEAEWDQRWNAHAEVTESDWLARLQHWEQYMPHSAQAMDFQPIAPHQLIKFVRSRSRRSATGLDGLARLDLLAMPITQVQQLCHVYSLAEASGRWPTPMLHGLVFAMQKHPWASSVSEHRPITVYSIAYRAWSSLRARQIICHISKVAPSSAQGNRTGGSAVGVWWRLQCALEFFQYQGTPLSGAILDVVKAFNHLPRSPIFRAAAYLQIPSPILVAWWGFIGTMVRHFDIRGSLSQGLTSSTGFAEGCGLSVVSMLIYDFIMDRWMFARWPSLSLVTYVDNISITAHDSALVRPAVDALDELMALSDMQLDKSKSLFWSLEASGRAALRHDGCQVCLSTRDLGGHMQFSKKQTNSTVTEKLAHMDLLWHRLGRSFATAAQKFRAARQCAWPKAFHSGSITHLGNHLIHHQRSSLMRAVRFSGKGINPWIQLGLCCPATTDPGFWLLFQSVSHFRRYAAPEVVSWILPETLTRSKRKLIPGPCGVLVRRLQEVQWAYVSESLFLDSCGHQVDLLRASPQELRLRLELAWHLRVACEVADRPDFQGLHQVDVRVTKQSLQTHPPDAQGFLRIVLTGGHVTPHESYADPAECLCRFCGLKDDLQHRHWTCASTEFSRQLIPQPVRACLDELPPCCVHHGWAVLPVDLQCFRDAVQAIPDTTGKFEAQASWWNPEVGIDLFPDGSLDFPLLPQVRLASWGVAVAHWEDPEWFIPLAHGGVPGLLQTVLRAELLAMICCMRFAASATGRCRVWCDNQLVLTRTQAILDGNFQVLPSTADGDLWQVIVELAPQVAGRLYLAKVTSHVLQAGLSPEEKWVVSGNDNADRLAMEAKQELSSKLLVVAEKLRLAITKMQDVVHALHAHFVRVARHYVSFPSVEPLPDSGGPTVAHEAVDFAQLSRQLQWDVPARFVIPPFSRVLQWMQQLVDGQVSPMFVAWHELYISFQLATQIAGVCKSGQKQWIVLPPHQPWQFLDQCRKFAQYVQGLLKLKVADFRSGWHKPSNPLYLCWTGGVWIRFAAPLRARVLTWMRGAIPALAIHAGGDLRELPRAEDEVELVAQVTPWR